VSLPGAPRAAGEEERRALRAALAAHGFDEAGCAARLGLPAIARVAQRAQLWRLVGTRAQFRPRCGPEADALDLLLALLLYGETVEAQALGARVGGAALDALRATGLVLDTDGGLRGAVTLFPCQHLLVATDRLDSVRTGNPVMPLFPESYDLGRTAARARIGRALDVCTGSGIHALLAAAHAGEAVGVDVSPRALSFARFNAWLNGIANAAFVEGDVYAALPAGARYGLITANPPYNPELDSAAGDDYHSGGESGEEIFQRLVEGVPERLEEEGIAQIITLLIHREGDPLEARVRRWLATHGDGRYDVLQLSKPVDYRPLVLKGGPLPPADQALHESWKRQRITRFEFGLLNLRRTPAGRAPAYVQGPSHESAEAHDVRALFASLLG